MKSLLFITLALLLSGCSKEAPQRSNDTVTIFVGIGPVANVANAIAAGNDNVEIETLVADGQSPHSFEPTAKQLARLAEAKLLITVGLPFEEALLKKISPLYPNLLLIEADAGIEKRAMPHEHHGEHCAHDHGAKDPHVWLSLPNLRLISDAILEALVRADPEREKLYRANHDELAQHLAAADEALSLRLAPFKGSRFLVYHPSFGYFADQHGLNQISIELDGKAPSPRQLADLIERAKIDGDKVIFVQKRFPVDSANAVARAIGGEVVQVDPLDKDVVATLHRIADGIARTSKP